MEITKTSDAREDGAPRKMNKGTAQWYISMYSATEKIIYKRCVCIIYIYNILYKPYISREKRETRSMRTKLILNKSKILWGKSTSTNKIFHLLLFGTRNCINKFNLVATNGGIVGKGEQKNGEEEELALAAESRHQRANNKRIWMHVNRQPADEQCSCTHTKCVAP